MVFSPSFSTEMNANRPLSAACVLSSMAEVEVVTTDFDHWTKERRAEQQFPPIARIVYLKTLPYYNNASLSRLVSHLIFSVRAGAYFFKRRQDVDIVYATLPFNTLAWLVFRLAGSRWKIVDVTDIWPDVLPFPPRLRSLGRPFFALWRKFFNRAAASADVMMAVSDSFFQETKKYVSPTCKSRRFYLAEVDMLRDVPKDDVLTIAYCGNVGRLYDFETLVDILAEAQPGSARLVIIGDGDRREWLLGELDRKGIFYKYFGIVYDSAKVGDILCRAHVGFNGFVNTTATFSTKSTTYFSAGLPILNSMGGDLQELVMRRGLGFNYQGGNRDSLRSQFGRLDKAVLRQMSENCRRFFSSELERTEVRSNMQSFLEECLEVQMRTTGNRGSGNDKRQ